MKTQRSMYHIYRSLKKEVEEAVVAKKRKKEGGKEKALENEGKWNNNVKNENTALGRSSQILPQSFVYSSFIKDVMSIIRFDILSYGLFLYNFVYSYTGYILYNIEYRVDRG